MIIALPSSHVLLMKWVWKIINLLIFRAIFSKAIYMMLLFEVLFDYFKNILELTIENRGKKYTWTCVGTD